MNFQCESGWNIAFFGPDDLPARDFFLRRNFRCRLLHRFARFDFLGLGNFLDDERVGYLLFRSDGFRRGQGGGHRRVVDQRQHGNFFSGGAFGLLDAAEFAVDFGQRGRIVDRQFAARTGAQREQDVRVELRSLDAEVLDAERALAVPGEDDVADVLARTEALRERGRGLVNLVTERARSLDRELASVADEGVVESLVAEAANVRTQLAGVNLDFDSLAPSRVEVEAAEAKVDALGVVSVAVAEGEFQRAAQELDQLRSRASTVEIDLARVREELGRIDAGRATLEPRAREAHAAQAEADRVRAEVQAQIGVSPELTAEARALRAAEDALREADTAHRRAESDASRWRARAEMLALALEEAHAAVGGDDIASIDVLKDAASTSAYGSRGTNGVILIATRKGP